MKSLLRFSNWPALLVLLGLACLGAKTPQAFVLWGSVALAISAALLWRWSPGSSLWGLAGIWVLVGVFSQCFSLDPSRSLYYTTQAFVFLLLWVALKIHFQKERNDAAFWRTLTLAGYATVGFTLVQYLHPTTPLSGLLPVNPNFNATWMACLATGLFGWILSTDHMPRAERQQISVLIILLAGLVIAGHSRSALLGMGLGFAYVLFLTGRKKELAGGLAICLLVLPLCFPHALLSRFHVSWEGAVPDYRLQIWKIALRSASERPWTGYGLGNFEIAYQRHAFPVDEAAVRFSRTTEFAHNEYLQVASDLGLPALGLLLVGLYLLFRAKAVKTRHLPSRAALIVLGTAAFFNPIAHLPFLLYVTLLWAAFGFSTQTELLGSPVTNQARMLRRVGAGCLIVITAALVGWFGLRAHWAVQGRWDQIVRWNPSDAEALKKKAYAQTDPSQAASLFADAIRYSPYDVYLHEAYAAALEHSTKPQDLKRAMEEYEVAWVLSPTRATNAVALGRLLVRHKQFGPALDLFKEAHHLEPYYWESDLWMARCLFWTGHKSQAIDFLKKLPARRDLFMRRFAGDSSAPKSEYERLILSYNASVVQTELRRFLSES